MIHTYKQKQIARKVKADLYITDCGVTRCGSVLFRYLINESGPSGHPPPSTRGSWYVTSARYCTCWRRTLRTHVYRFCPTVCECVRAHKPSDISRDIIICATVFDHDDRVWPYATVCECVRLCATVCDHAQLPEWPTVAVDIYILIILWVWGVNSWLRMRKQRIPKN